MMINVYGIIKVSVFGLICFLGATGTIAAQASTCDLIYDEFDSLMNKRFLVSPESYVPVVKNRMSRKDYRRQQKADFLLNVRHENSGVAIVRTDSNRWGKFLFSWDRTSKTSAPLLTIKELVLYNNVKDGSKPKIRRNIKLRSSFTLDLDSGRVGSKGADVWFHNIDNKRMFIEARNGAQLMFPMASLCNPKSQHNRFKEFVRDRPILLPVERLPNAGTQTPLDASENSASKTVIDRQLLSNGNVIINYSDGSKIEKFKGGIKRFPADGGPPTTLLFHTAAPFAVPVADPGSDEEAWLLGHSSALRDTLISLVGDSDSVDEALIALETSTNPYDNVAIRSNLIQQLVSP